MQDIKDSLKMTKSEKMIGKTHGTRCVDLSVCMDYLQVQTKKVEKSNKDWSYIIPTKWDNRDLSRWSFFVERRVIASAVIL